MKKKHPCPDCQQCQWCSDSRCALCLGEKGCRKNLSIAEQIALYDKRNPCGCQGRPFTLEDAPARKD